MEESPNQAEGMPGDPDPGNASNGSERHETGAYKAANALFVAAALIFVWSTIAIITNNSYGPQVMMLHLLEAGMLVLLAFLSRKKPFTSLIVGLVLFIALWVVTAAMDKANLYSGIIVKIFVVIYMVRAIPDARRFERNH
ncbi:MAG: hypothetical protein C5B52_12400 [Bacteroidetes bacterium]|nr:MAG: hypothetical protein C5B52_12400 [Bacteroidota bacterium]